MESVYVTFHLPLLYWFLINLFLFYFNENLHTLFSFDIAFPQFDMSDESIVFCQEYATNFLTCIGFTGLVSWTPISVEPGNVKLFTVYT